jgi:hypothetical protein
VAASVMHGLTVAGMHCEGRPSPLCAHPAGPEATLQVLANAARRTYRLGHAVSIYGRTRMRKPLVDRPTIDRGCALLRVSDKLTSTSHVFVVVAATGPLAIFVGFGTIHVSILAIVRIWRIARKPSR